MAQSAEPLTLMVCEIETHVGLGADILEPAWDSFSPPLCPSPAFSLPVSLSK